MEKKRLMPIKVTFLYKKYALFNAQCIEHMDKVGNETFYLTPWCDPKFTVKSHSLKNLGSSVAWEGASASSTLL